MADSRLEAALKRAAELVEELEGMGPTTMSTYLAGWAEAVQALGTQYHHPIHTCADWPSGKCAGCKNIDTFCNAMLGEEKSDA
ncbi:hypothetical protein LCGC14_2438810 [marine sediment metagenome]|uniref:Uncharacterized protein n=1 Tax=marine sediment metagenome TaxID=412755 RepID=A0A0F9BJT8_9ZZZZ